MARHKQEWINRLLSDMARLQSVGSDYAATLDQLQKSIKQFIKSEDIGIKEMSSWYSLPGFDHTSGYAQKNPYIPAELSMVVQLLDKQLTLMKRGHADHSAFMDLFKKQLVMAFDAAKTCDSCGQLNELSQMRHLPPPQDNIFICEECFENEYFDCHKCKKVLPMCEMGEEDDYAGYGYFCKDCIKPMGFPQEVVIAPDFPECEYVVGATLDALCKYAYQATGWMEPEYSDTITLKFVKKLSEYDALYESQKGVKYEISELDYRGIGSMRELEE